MSKETAIVAGETGAAALRAPHVRRVVDAARASRNPSTRRTTALHGAASRRGADRQGLSTMPAAPGNGCGVPRLAARRTPEDTSVAVVARWGGCEQLAAGNARPP